MRYSLLTDEKSVIAAITPHSTRRPRGQGKEKGMIHYKKIERTIDSLSQSTDLTVSLQGETVVFSGLNSPYVSHQGLAVTTGHGVPRLVTFGNGRHWLGIVPSHDNKKVGGDCAIVPVPSFYFKPLFQFPALMPDCMTGIVNVIIPDGFL